MPDIQRKKTTAVSLPKPDHWQTPEFASQRLAAIIESAEDAIISKTLDGIITSWNSGAERIFGYTGDEMVGRPIMVLIPPDHINEEPEILGRIRAGERVDHYETVRVRKDGSLVDISLTVSPIRANDGTIIGASKVARDISERKRTEQALREETEIIETVNRLGLTLAGELDLHKLVQAVTDAATDISDAQFGSFFYNVPNEQGESQILYAVAGVPIEAFQHFSMPRKIDIVKTSFKGKGVVLLDDITEHPHHENNSPYYGMTDGQLPVSSYLAVPIISRSGEIYGGLFFGHSKKGAFSERVGRIVEGLAAQAAIAMDNARLYEAAQRARTEAEQAADDKERLYRRAEESSRLKDEFLATVSHELRTPLNAILGWTRMLRMEKLSSTESERALETVERNARAQAQLIEDLLDVSSIITGKLRMDVRAANPTAFIQAAIEAVRPAAEAKGVHIQTLMDTEIVSLAGDPVRLQQIVWNLLSNAIKFTPGGGRVQIRLEQVNSHIQIVVSDTGPGIPAEFLPFVFDRFRQADQRTSRQHGGMGLGLAIVRHLVELHGGSVEASSREGEGSTFTVRLPVAPVYRVDETIGSVHSSPRDLAAAPEGADRLDGLKVLVIDDEIDTRDLLLAGLGQCGAEVVAAGSVAEALKALTTFGPDVIISDIGMPEQDGYELIRQLRSLPSDKGGAIPAISLTAYARVEDRMRALRAGYQMHVPKPVELAELVAVVASLAKRLT